MMGKRSRRRRGRKMKRMRKRPWTNEPSRNLSTKPVVAFCKSARI